MKIVTCTVTNKTIAEGLVSYTVKQAAIQRQLCASFQALYKLPLHQMEMATQVDEGRSRGVDDEDEDSEEEGGEQGSDDDDGLDV